MAGERNKEKKDTFSREAIVHLDPIYRVALYLVEEPDEAHDVVQETYVRALGSYEQFTPGSNMKGWLSRILYNFFFVWKHHSEIDFVMRRIYMDYYNYEAYGQCEVGAPDFKSVVRVGTKAPEFTLTSEL